MPNQHIDKDKLNLEGKAAPPMANGELVFDAPWQGRVFGIARLMCESGYYQWDEFREYLIEEIRVWDRNPGREDAYHYYDFFFCALEKLLEKKEICMSPDLLARVETFVQRADGHDHRHI